MYNWTALLYTRNEHNSVNQLYANIKLKKLEANIKKIKVFYKSDMVASCLHGLPSTNEPVA